MTNDPTKHSSAIFLVIFSVIALSFLYLSPAFASAPLSDEQEQTVNELMKGYGSGASGFWSVFGDIKEKIDGPVLEKMLDHAAAKRDATLVALVLESARIRGDEKMLTSLMLSAADLLLSIGRHDEALKLYDSAMPLARSLEDPVLMAKAHEGNGDIAFYSGNPTNALLMYRRAADLYARGNSLPGQGIVARKMGDVLIQTGDNGQAARVLERALGILKGGG